MVIHGVKPCKTYTTGWCETVCFSTLFWGYFMEKHGVLHCCIACAISIDPEPGPKWNADLPTGGSDPPSVELPQRLGTDNEVTKAFCVQIASNVFSD